MRKKLLVLLGPTSTGKTDLALYLAKKFNGEIVACDSRQVYKSLDIGTGKYSSVQFKVKIGKGYWELDGIRIWMYDVVSLKKQYTVASFVKDAREVLKDINRRGKLPILVGGTGLYIKALVEGLSSLQIPLDKRLREKLLKLNLRQLQNKIKKISPKKWSLMNNSDQNNPRRLIRAIEIAIAKPVETNKDNVNFSEINVLKVGLNAPREILYEKINKRVFKWLEEGIIDEVKKLRKLGVSSKRFKKLGLEYGIIVDFLDGKISETQMIEKMQIKVRQYARRQITWFKKDENIFWFDILDKKYPSKVENFITKWYHLS